MRYSDTAPSGSSRKPSAARVSERLNEFIDSKNIAELIKDEDELKLIGQKVLHEYEIDIRSNDEWRKMAAASLDAALQIPEQKNTPWEKASNVKWPLIAVAALQFGARAYPAICNGDQIVNAKVIGSDNGIPKKGPDGQPMMQPDPKAMQAMGGQGQPPGPMGAGMPPQAPQMPMVPVWEKEPGAKRKQADRIAKHMSYQLTEEMPEWEEDTDALLMQLPILGTAFRKVYYDPVLGRNVAQMASGLDVVVNKATRSLETAPRITHCIKRHPIECQEKMIAGIWLDCDLGTPTDGSGDEDAPHEFLEQQRYIDLDKDGYREPYIVTVHKDTAQVVRIVANFGLTDITMGPKGVERIQRRDYFVPYGFIPDPKGGFYHIGFGQLLASLSGTIDTTINQMIDAASLQTAGGGLIGAGVRLKKGTIGIKLGQYQYIDAPGGKIREAIYNWEHPGPSAVLFNLLGLLISAAKDITGVQDILTGDTHDKNQTATTTLALIEQGLKVFTAIYKRIYRSLKQEFKLLYRLNAENLPEEAYFTVLDEQEAIARKDYDNDNYDICPQADPKLVTDMQKMARAQALAQTIEMNPEGRVEILRRLYQAIGAEDIDRLLPPPPPPDPMMVKGAEAEIRLTEGKAAQAETEAMKNVAEIEDNELDQSMQAMQMGEGKRQFDESAMAGERRAGEKMKVEQQKGRAA